MILEAAKFFNYDQLISRTMETFKPCQKGGISDFTSHHAFSIRASLKECPFQNFDVSTFDRIYACHLIPWTSLFTKPFQNIDMSTSGCV
mmetsp:Transcript_3291/g.6074  ORF Transcript_3291/g.6074 Transcript_3291/m.6074 type:complete len:89 (+) Transcript_3291:111-377(+)